MNWKGPITMNERAKTFADLFHRFAQDVPDTLHIYMDGLVMAVSGMSDRHLDIRDILERDYPGFEEARAGNISVFLIPMDMTATEPGRSAPPLKPSTAGPDGRRFTEFTGGCHGPKRPPKDDRLYRQSVAG